jgi:hypothetical protein
MDFSETLLRRESKNSGYLGAHEGINSRYLHERHIKPEPGRAKEPLDRPPRRRHLTEFDPRDHGLRGPRPRGEGPLTEAGPEPSGAKEPGKVGFHPCKIADRLSRMGLDRALRLNIMNS